MHVLVCAYSTCIKGRNTHTPVHLLLLCVDLLMYYHAFIVYICVRTYLDICIYIKAARRTVIGDCSLRSLDRAMQACCCCRGELLVRGPGLMKGYFLDKEKTDEAFDAEGWLRTGDVVEIQPSGAVKIIDRAKNIFKLAHVGLALLFYSSLFSAFVHSFPFRTANA